MDPEVEVFQPRKRQRQGNDSHAARSAGPHVLLAFTKAPPQDGRMAVNIHGVVKVVCAKKLSVRPQDDEIECQRTLYSGRGFMLETSSLHVFDQVVNVHGDHVQYAGHWGRFSGVAMLTDALREHGFLTAKVPRGVRLDAVHVAPFRSRTLTALMVAESVPAALGIRIVEQDFFEARRPQAVAVLPVAEEVLMETTTSYGRPEGDQPVTYTFTPEVILKALQMQSLLKTGADMTRVFMLAAEMIMTPASLRFFKQQLELDQHRLPQRSILYDAKHKLVTLEMLYERHRHTDTVFSRHWSPDSSPQGGWNFLVIIESRCSWPASTDVEDREQKDS